MMTYLHKDEWRYCETVKPDQTQISFETSGIDLPSSVAFKIRSNKWFFIHDRFALSSSTGLI